MARFAYEWQQTEHGRCLVRRPSRSAREAAAAETTNLSTLTKPELVELAGAQGKDTSGTKADIIERLSDD